MPRTAIAGRRSTSVRTGGRLLDGRYELRSVLARGGMGQVWLATDTVLGRRVAIKVLRSEFSHDPAFLARFRTEARHAGLLADPNIAAVYDYGESPDADGGGDVAYLVMELVDGKPLSDLLAQEPSGLGTTRTLSIVRQTASALAAAHAAGVVHRDVKPANILVASSGAVKLTDFGIAWSAANLRLTHTGEVLGTAHYLAPEQVEGQKATPASDVYSLGVVAYECLAGRRPFEGGNSLQTALRHINEFPPALPEEVPEGVRTLVQHAMARDPADRLRDGAALRDAIDARSGTPGAALHEQQTVVLPIGPASIAAAREPDQLLKDDRPVTGRRRRGAGSAVAAMAAVVALVLLGLVLAGAVVGSSLSSTPAHRSVPAPTVGISSRPTSSTAIRLSNEDLIGRPLTEVKARLTALGLQVELRGAETTDLPPGTVVGLDPPGDAVSGQWVTITYAIAPVTAPSAAATSAGARESAAPSATSAGTTSARSRHGNGNGKGSGHGKNG